MLHLFKRLAFILWSIGCVSSLVFAEDGALLAKQAVVSDVSCDSTNLHLEAVAITDQEHEMSSGVDQGLVDVYNSIMIDNHLDESGSAGEMAQKSHLKKICAQLKSADVQQIEVNIFGNSETNDIQKVEEVLPTAE